MDRSIILYALVIGLSMSTVALAEREANKPKKVKCKDKWYPKCYHKPLFCPAACPRKCFVDCAKCQTVCSMPSPSPPPPPPKRHRRSPPPPRNTYSPPPAPPTPQLPSTPPPSPPPPASSGGGSTLYLSPPPPFPSPPPSSEASGAKRVRCRNRNYARCYGMELTCPSACPQQCEVDCVTCRPVCNCNKPGAVCQDPRFVGGDGITFYFHGKKDADFCLVSDQNLHINAHFIGKRNPNLTRDFTWVQSIGILFDRHHLFLGAAKTAAWDDAVDRLSLSLDGHPIPLPASDVATWQSSDSSRRVTVSRLAVANWVEVEVEGLLKITARVVPITAEESRVHSYGVEPEEDCFAHLDLGFRFYALSGEVEGVLGKTYGRNYVSRVKMGVAMPVVGGEREYAASGLFTADCAAARFGKGGGGGDEEVVEFGDLSCASTGMDGRGVVCKR